VRGRQDGEQCGIIVSYEVVPFDYECNPSVIQGGLHFCLYVSVLLRKGQVFFHCRAAVRQFLRDHGILTRE
jgi:hypothetical protein